MPIIGQQVAVLSISLNAVLFVFICLQTLLRSIERRGLINRIALPGPVSSTRADRKSERIQILTDHAQDLESKLDDTTSMMRIV